MNELRTPAQLLRAVLAQQVLDYAKALLPLIRQQKGTGEGAALYGALCVYYMRAFTENKGVGSFSADVVPKRFEGTHAILKEYRNRIAAHPDSCMEYKGHAINAVYFRKTEAALTVENRHIFPTSGLLERVENLIDALRSQFSVSVSECLASGPPSEEVLSKGLFKLGGETPSDWQFVEVEDDGLDDGQSGV